MFRRKAECLHTHIWVQFSPQGADRVKPMLALNCFVISPSETLLEETDEAGTATEGF
jgi:hypothetical protein